MRYCVLLKVEISFQLHANAEFVKNIGEDAENSNPVVQLVKWGHKGKERLRKAVEGIKFCTISQSPFSTRYLRLLHTTLRFSLLILLLHFPPPRITVSGSLLQGYDLKCCHYVCILRMRVGNSCKLEQRQETYEGTLLSVLQWPSMLIHFLYMAAPLPAISYFVLSSRLP